jgi:peptidoglycan/xylan/chitin deacetylase (PgdA/CDA1 family)
MTRTVLSLCLLLLLASAPSASAAVGDELVRNGGLEAGGNSPDSWSKSTWGTHEPTFAWSTNAPHSGNRSARVEVSKYSNGDSKWLPEMVPVTAGAYYTFSDWYKSNASTAVSVYYELATDTDKDGDGRVDGHWANLFSGLSPAAVWTQYKTGFTMPAGAVRARFVHYIARNGWLETDDYSLTEEEAPPGFNRPMISLTFDDGSQGFWDHARNPLNAKGFKTTQYVPTEGLTTIPRNTFLMTPAEITTLASEGHEIGAHSVTHPLMTSLTDKRLEDELVESKEVLEGIPGVGTVRNFAYPFGDYDARVIAAAKDAGYRSARSVEEGYNSKLDLEHYDIRAQNITPDTTLAEFKSWIEYAKAHNYWLVLVYHEVVPDSSPRCTHTSADPDVCLGDFDTTVGGFNAQLNAISSAGLGSSVVTVQEALDTIDAETHGPRPGANVAPAHPTTGAIVPAAPPVASPDRTAPKIVVASPRARRYKLGRSLKIKVYGTDDSGLAVWTATVRRSGGKSRTVNQGQRLRLSRTGKYVLRVTAKDRSGNVAHKSVRFRVVR